jgi:hypothetical protein
MDEAISPDAERAGGAAREHRRPALDQRSEPTRQAARLTPEILAGSLRG